MKAIFADLTADVVGTYDQTKTTIPGRAISKTIGGKTVLGPPLNKFLDVIADSTLTPSTIVSMSPNGRIYVINAEASGLVQIALYSINYSNMSTSYVGRIQCAIQITRLLRTLIERLRLMIRALPCGSFSFVRLNR